MIDLSRFGTGRLVLIDRWLTSFDVRDVETFDRLPHQRLAKLNTPVDLLGQDLEALVAERARLLLPRLGERWKHREVISRMVCDRLADYADITLKAVESFTHLIETTLHEVFGRSLRT